jgi:predicted transcriptional regulator
MYHLSGKLKCLALERLTMPRLAKDIMTPHVKSVPENWSLQKFAGFLTDNRISGSTVVDSDNNIVGIATLTDIADFHMNEVKNTADERLTPEEQKEARYLRSTFYQGLASMQVEVRDIMSPIVISMDQNTPVDELAQKMIDEQIHRIFIRCGDDVVGIVTTFDMMKLVAQKDPG